jgi:exonuclease SbcC
VIPRRLRLRNFLSYRECVLDFTGLHLAVLAGRNGDGKSALLDAMTWALWGEGRGRVEDDRILLGADEMLVEFEFEVSGDVYQVVRKRTRGRGTGALDLLLIDANGMKTALNGGTMTETQRDLTRRLHLDYDTFVNSAFLAQGRANEFTQKKPAERKELFRKILGLEQYQQLADAANDRRKAVASDAQAEARATEADRGDAARLPEVEAQLAQVAAASTALAPLLATLADEVASLKMAALDYQRRQTERANAARRIEEATAAAANSERAAARAEADLVEVRRLIAGGEEIEDRHARLETVRSEEQALAALQTRAREHEGVVVAAEREIGEEQARIVTRIEALKAETVQTAEAAAMLDRLTAEAAASDTERETLEAMEKQIEEARQRENRLREEAAGSRAEAVQCREQNAAIKGKEDQLDGEVAACPVCGQPLSPADLQHVRDEYLSQREVLRKTHDAARDRAKVKEEEAAREQATVATLQRSHRTRQESLRLRERELHSRLAAAQQAVDELPNQREMLLAAEQHLTDASFADAARTRARAATEALATLGYDGTAHADLRRELESLAGVDGTYREWLMAVQRAESLEATIVRERQSQAENAARLTEAESALAAAEEELESATDVGPRLSAAEDEVAGLRAQQADLSRAQGRYENDRDHLLALVARIQTALDRITALKEEEGVFSDLNKAFGRDGIQALLIDNALPQVESYANEMLLKMTGGRIHVSLETQRQSARGTSIETLDIRISDELGTRDYEMYSGGEAFRVDFALRIALARVLAARTGSDLPTLIIDEGFGSQDQEGIDRLMEALTAVAPEFKLILVVTHIEELRERFDRRIEVTKDPQRGSLARVV